MTMLRWRVSLAPSNASMSISKITRPAKKPKPTSLPILWVSIIGNAAIRLWATSHQRSSSGVITLTCLNSLSTFSGKAQSEDVRQGLTYKQFAKYALMKLGVENDITRFVRKNVPRRLAPREEVLARMTELGLSA